MPRADRLKLLYWDGSGLVMAYKRLEEVAFMSRCPRGHLLRPGAEPNAG